MARGLLFRLRAVDGGFGNPCEWILARIGRRGLLHLGRWTASEKHVEEALTHGGNCTETGGRHVAAKITACIDAWCVAVVEGRAAEGKRLRITSTVYGHFIGGQPEFGRK